MIFVGVVIARESVNIFNRKYNKYNKIHVNVDATAGDFALRAVNESEYRGLNVAYVNSPRSDCFSIKKNLIIISETTMKTNSVASFATVAHEYGHALQHNSGKLSFRFMTTLSKIMNTFSAFIFPLLLVGCIFKIFGIASEQLSGGLIVAGLVLLTLAILNQIVNISVEFDASKKGLEFLRKYDFMNKKELRMARKFLKSAGWTYVGSFLSYLLCWTLVVKKY